MSSSPLFIDVDCYHRRKYTEHVCGDAFVSKRMSGEGRLVAVLSDGLGSGIKANILARMTATMAERFTEEERDPLRSAEIIMDALPVCQIRKISYATFSIIDCSTSGPVRIVEEGNPDFILLRDGREEPVQKEVVVSEKWPDRKIQIARFSLEPGDRIIFCSDGVTQAGLGCDAWKLGWRREGLVEFAQKLVGGMPDLSSRTMAREIVEEAIRKEPDLLPHDDISAAVFHFHHPRRLLLWTGPPYEKERDHEYAVRFSEFSGRKIISGGTTANIASRELHREITMSMPTHAANVPNASRMGGVDLVTEGVLTLAKTLEYLEEDRHPPYRDTALDLADMLLESDTIEFMVGTRINEAHLDPSLPVTLGFRRNLVERISRLLREKFLKEVSIVYI